METLRETLNVGLHRIVIVALQRRFAMPALQVRDFPENLYEKLKVCAEREHRSVAQQTIVAVERMLRSDETVGVGMGQWTAGRIGDAQSSSIYFDYPTKAERAVRIEKRKALFDEIDRMHEKYDMTTFSTDEIIRWTRESREERTNGILRDIGRDGIADKAETEEALMWTD